MGRPRDKDEYRKELADAFIHVLEEKGLEWKKEWHGPGIRMPINAVTESRYNGINRLWLGICAMENGYEDPRWATFNQIADMDGKYTLSVPVGATLSVSFIGYSTQTITVGSESVYNVVLKEDTEFLEETVVIGYGVQRKSDAFAGGV